MKHIVRRGEASTDGRIIRSTEWLYGKQYHNCETGRPGACAYCPVAASSLPKYGDLVPVRMIAIARRLRSHIQITLQHMAYQQGGWKWVDRLRPRTCCRYAVHVEILIFGHTFYASLSLGGSSPKRNAFPLVVAKLP